MADDNNDIIEEQGNFTGPSNNVGINDVPGSLTSFGQNITNAIQKTGITNLPSQVFSRLNGAVLPGGLPMIGKMGVPGPVPRVGSEQDWRLRISLPSGSTILYKDRSNAMLGPLVATNGVVFPITPSVSQLQHTANWEAVRLTHSNYPALFYNGSEVNDIQISGDFPVQSVKDADYVVAVIQFFRSVTKMFFGNSDPNTGNPPPICLLDGYGTSILNKVPVVVKMATFDLPQDVDYVASSNGSRVATLSKVTITVQPIYSRKQVATFSYNSYSRGQMPGFL